MADEHSRKTDDSQGSSQSNSDQDTVCFSSNPDESSSSSENEPEDNSNRSREQVSESDDKRTSSPEAGISYVHSNEESPEASTRSISGIALPRYYSRSSELVNARDSFFDPRHAVKNTVPNSSSPASNVTDGPGPQADADWYEEAWNWNPTEGPNQTRSAESSSRTARKPQADFGSNGNKLSKFQPPDSSANSNLTSQGVDNDSDDEGPWLCSHYKRRCHVKFSCCDEYWPCHRCHNNESKCGEKKLRARDTKYIKCVNCGTEQEFSEGSQFCVNCNIKLAKYFCAICKHLTGTDDNPHHCEKCGICRIDRDRSFHCDVCGVCLDVKLRGNHICRAGSAHEECCICLEDIFTGCRILPCSHRMHKECQTLMIRAGNTRCPICNESFAHKLERRLIQPPKKQSGKNRPARKPQADFGSNGNKLSKFQPPDSPANSNRSSQGVDNDSDDEDPWLCSHYKRRCHVKFSCCDEYWPCHRCHNNESKCGEKKLRSRDTKYIKCVNCGTEQEFSERSQFCVNCDIKLAKYFCAICKHLTGTDDNPYHCEKCGICRIDRDRSFHCDVCGFCLDVKLRGNHICRAGSAHEKCFICLGDLFRGCQILPCSHKVHMECLTQMIRRRLTRCPICGESFAHILERRPIQPPRKQSGKK